MKRLVVLILIFIPESCSKKAGTNENPSESADGQTIHCMAMKDGKMWMTENLNIEIPGTWCQLDDTANCVRYGRLYTWEAAKNGCNQLGSGWRLPTNEEWQLMVKKYGGYNDDSEDKGKTAYLNLSEGGSSAFNALLGGSREAGGSYERLGAHGFFLSPLFVPTR